MPAVKLKIGFVFDDSLDRSDGVQQYIKTLGRWLMAEGHTVVYLVGQTKMPDYNGAKVYSLAKNMQVSFNGNKLSIPLPAGNRRIKAAISREKFDVLHVQTPYSPFMGQKIIKSADGSTAVVGTFHILPAGRFQSIGARLLSLWCRRSLKRFNQFFSVSSSAQLFAKKVFKIDSLVLPNVVDIKRFQNLKKPPANGYRIVFLGRLVNRKGCGHLISAAAILNKTMPNFELVIAGDGPDMQKMKNLALSLGLADKVKFLGYISEDSKAELLGSANIACFPSLYGESFGIVLIEAMASGSEVVLGGDNPGYASVLADNPGLLFEPGDHQKLAGLLSRFLANPQLRKRTQAWQKQHVMQYDVDVVGRRLVEHYQQLVEKQRLTAHNSSQ